MNYFLGFWDQMYHSTYQLKFKEVTLHGELGVNLVP